MNNNLKLFQTVSEYVAFAASTAFTTPNVSAIEEEIGSASGVRYNPYQYVPPVYDAGTIVLYGTANHDLKFVPYTDYTKAAYSGYIPQGVVVVPNNHTTDGTVRIMSLKNMSCANPRGGSVAQSGVEGKTTMYWGENSTDILELVNQRYVPTTNAQGATSSTPTISLNQETSYLPSDYQTGTQSGLDPQGKYYSNASGNYYGISPYLSDGSQCPYYLSGATSEMDGSVNTAILVSRHTAQTTSETMTSVSDTTGATHAPAVCCNQYRTEAFGQGAWYLPACGELGYLLARYGAINAALDKLMQEDSSNAVRLCMRSDSDTTTFGGWLWSSSELISGNARCVSVTSATVSYYSKNTRGVGQRVRAFVALNV